MISLILAVLFSGGRRLRAINALRGDPIAERFCSLQTLPRHHVVNPAQPARSLARWMGQFDNDALIALRRVNEELVGSLI